MAGVIECSDLALKRKSSDENLYLKRAGALAMNLGDLKLYRASGPLSTDTWITVDGVTTITPVIMPETTALSVRWAALGTPRTLVGSIYEAPIDRYMFKLSDASLLSHVIYLHLLGGPFQNAAVLSFLPAPVSATNYDGTEVSSPVWAALSSAGGGYTFGAGQNITMTYNMFATPTEGASATAFCIFGFNMTASASNGYDLKDASIKAKLRLRNTSGARMAMGGTTEVAFPVTASNGPHFLAADVTGAIQRGWDEGQLAMSAATGGTGAPTAMQYGDATATNRQLFLGGAINLAPSASQHLTLRDEAYALARGLGISI